MRLAVEIIDVELFAFFQKHLRLQLAFRIDIVAGALSHLAAFDAWKQTRIVREIGQLLPDEIDWCLDRSFHDRNYALLRRFGQQVLGRN